MVEGWIIKIKIKEQTISILKAETNIKVTLIIMETSEVVAEVTM